MVSNRFEIAVLVGGYVVSVIAGVFAFYVIRKYHGNKPLGMQTLLGQVTILTTKIFTAQDILKVTSLCVVEIVGKFQDVFAMIWLTVEYYVMILWYLSLLTIVITKYCSIYHGTLLANVNKESTLKNLKIFFAVAPGVVTFLEYTFFTNYYELSYFQVKTMGYSEPDGKTEFFSKIIILLTFLAFMLLHVRIEISACYARDVNAGFIAKITHDITLAKEETGSSPRRYLKSFKALGYDMKVARIFTVCIVAVAVIVLYQITIGASNFKWNLFIGINIINVVIPYLIIYNHDGMKRLAVKSCKSLLMK